MNNKTMEAVKKAIEEQKTRSAWSAGVKAYALEIIEEVQERSEWEGHEPETERELIEYMLNGAKDWQKPNDIYSAWRVYSEGGCSLIYNEDIACRLCTPSELKKTDNGRKDPNPRENWIDCQARALFQAGEAIRRKYRELRNL